MSPQRSLQGRQLLHNITPIKGDTSSGKMRPPRVRTAWGKEGCLTHPRGGSPAWVMCQGLRKNAARPSSPHSRSMLLQHCKIMCWTKEHWRTYPPAKELFFFHRVFRGTGQAWHLSRLFFDILSSKCMSETHTHTHTNTMHTFIRLFFEPRLSNIFHEMAYC